MFWIVFLAAWVLPGAILLLFGCGPPPHETYDDVDDF